VFFALELVSDRATKSPSPPTASSSPAMNRSYACRDEGLLIFANFNRLHVVRHARSPMRKHAMVWPVWTSTGVAEKYYTGANRGSASAEFS